MSWARPVPVVVMALVVALVSSGCSGGSAKTPPAAAPTSTTAVELVPPSTAPPAPSLTADQIDHVIGTSFEYGVFRITVGHAVYDRKEGSLTVGMRFTNLGSLWSQSEIAGHLLAGGTDVPFSGRPYTVPPFATVDVTGAAFSLTADPVADGRLVWGSTTANQPVITLDGSGGEHLWLTTPIAADGWIQIGKYGIHVIGASLRGGSADLGVPAPPGQRILRVDFDLFTARAAGANGFGAIQHFVLRLPDGTEVDPTHGSPLFNPISWTLRTGEWVEFPVPESVDGTVALALRQCGRPRSRHHPARIDRPSHPRHRPVGSEIRPGS